MKYILPSLFFLISTISIAQKVNNYQYVVVPEKYSALKKVDQHQVNSLTKFLLNKYGFEAYLDIDDKPFNMADTSCDILYAELINDSNFIQTRLSVVLKDCEGEIIYKTTQGRSKKKDFKAAYHEALRDAFEDIKDLNYTYIGTKKKVSQKRSTVIEETKEEVTQSKELKQPEPKFDLVEERKEAGEEIKEVIVEKAPRVSSSELDSSKPQLFMSQDGFYKAVRFGDSITFYEGDKSIGNSSILREDGFLVTTSEFEGKASFKEGSLLIERTIKGVVGVVQMIFIEQ